MTTRLLGREPYMTRDVKHLGAVGGSTEGGGRVVLVRVVLGPLKDSPVA